MVRCRYMLLLVATMMALGALVEATFLYGKGDPGDDLWKGKGATSGFDLWKGKGEFDLWKGKGDKGFDLWKGKGMKGMKGWIEDKGVPSLQTSCQVVYDDVWEEKCQTVYNDVCQDVPAKECQVVQEKECGLKEVEECSFVLENKCASIPIPECSIKWEKQCSKQPVCRTEVDHKCRDVVNTVCTTINDHQCTVVQKEVCHTNVDKQCKTLLDKVCKMVPVAVPTPVQQPTTFGGSFGSGGWTADGVDAAWQGTSSAGLPTENQVNLGAFKGRFEGPAGSFKESPAYIKVPNLPDNIIPPTDPRISRSSSINDGTLGASSSQEESPKETSRRRRRRSAEAITIPRSLTFGHDLEAKGDRMPMRFASPNEDEKYKRAMQLLHKELQESQADPRSSREERSISDLLAKKVALKLKKKAAILEAKKNFKLEKAALLMSHVNGWSQGGNSDPAWTQGMMVSQPAWIEQVSIPPASVVEYVEMCQKVPREVCVEKPQKVCQQVPEEQCHDVPREQCRDVPQQLCTDEPREVCEDKEFCKEMPKQNCDVKEKQKCTPFPSRKCTKVPKEQCRTYPREVCTEVVSRKCSVVPDKVCQKITVKRPREVCIPNSSGASSGSSSSWGADVPAPFKEASDLAAAGPVAGSSGLFSGLSGFL